MPPTRERFPSAHDLGAKVDDRLVVRLELVSGESDADLIQQASMVVDVLAQARLEHAELVTTVELGFVQRDVGVLEQCVGRRDLRAAETGADADRGLEHGAVRIERPTRSLDDGGRSSPKVGFVAHAVKHDRELVAPKTGHEVGAPDGLRQSPTRFLQQLVPDRVSVRIVDRLEAVDVDDAHGQDLARRPGTGTVDVRLERATVGQARENILVSQEPQSFFRLSLARDVLDDADEAPRSAGRIDLREHPRAQPVPPAAERNGTVRS